MVKRVRDPAVHAAALVLVSMRSPICWRCNGMHSDLWHRVVHVNDAALVYVICHGCFVARLHRATFQDVCWKCRCRETPMWRRYNDPALGCALRLCNACALRHERLPRLSRF